MMDLLSELVHNQGVAAIVSTHDPLLVARADTVIELHDGKVASTKTGLDSLSEHSDTGTIIGTAGAPARSR